MPCNSVYGPTSFHLSDVFVHEFSVCKINFFPSSIKNLLKLMHYFMYRERILLMSKLQKHSPALTASS